MQFSQILGIESSCDETAASVVRNGEVLSDVIASQVTVHKPYGGVVPELASRHHIANMGQVIEESLTRAHVSLKDIDGIAATRGPGLIGALLVGLETAKSLAYALKVPFVAVNHLRGHLLAARIANKDASIPSFPYMALLASGGHTGVYLVQSETEMRCLGTTRDDAAGEAYDKVAKLLGLGYPGGPIIDKFAAEPGDEVEFPQALRQRRSYEFSFSGVKTAVAQYVGKRGSEVSQEEIHAICRGFQRAIVEILVRKVTLAAREHQIPRVVLAGGVAANQGLREHALNVCQKNNLDLFAPSPDRCTDNGAMIAYTGYLALNRDERSKLSLGPKANWPVD